MLQSIPAIPYRFGPDGAVANVTVCPFRSRVMPSACIPKQEFAADTSFCKTYVVPELLKFPHAVSGVPELTAPIVTENGWLAVCGTALESAT